MLRIKVCTSTNALFYIYLAHHSYPPKTKTTTSKVSTVGVSGTSKGTEATVPGTSRTTKG